MVAVWLLAIATAIAAVAAVSELYGVGLAGKAISGSLTDQEARRFGDVSFVVGAAYLVAFVVAAIAFLAWLSRAIDNLPALGAGRSSASPRWAIGWWFIPIANLGMPYEVVRELRGRLREDPRRVHPPLLLAWWFTFISASVLFGALSRIPSATTQQLATGLTVAAISFGLTAVAGVFAVLVVRDIERRAAARAASVTSPAAPPQYRAAADWDAGERRTGWRMRPSWVGFVAVSAAFAAAIAVPLLATQPAANLKHEAPALEAGLPDVVAGQLLLHWSLQGEDYFVGFVGLGADDLAQLKADLAGSGLTIDDVSVAAAIRAHGDDAPNVVFAVHVRGVDSGALPDDILLDHPGAGSFTPALIAGKSVRQGSAAMVEQSDQLRGSPYLYDMGEIRYIVITDDPEWAADAFGQLP